jgi:hypothetical protein
MPVTVKAKLRKARLARAGRSRLLYRRTPEYRQILLLELLAWAIRRAETCEDFAAFECELRETRQAEWGTLPWSGAKDAERFERHVLDIARAFTTSAPYKNRRHEPER